MNRKRREIPANIFADLAGYTIGAGLLAGFWSGKLTAGLTVAFLVIFGVMTAVGYALLGGQETALVSSHGLTLKSRQLTDLTCMESGHSE